MEKGKIKLGVVGGAHCVHLKKRLAKLDRKIYDITIISSVYASDKIVDGCAIFSVDINKFKYIRHFHFFLKYASFIRKKKFDVIYCFGALSPLSWLAGLLARKYLVVTTIGSDVFLDDQIPTTSLIRKNTKELLQSADMVITLLSYMNKRLREYFKIPQHRIIRDFLALDEEWLSLAINSIRPKEFQKHAPILLSPRMMSPLYQQIVLIKMLAILKKDFPDILLVQSTFSKDPVYFKECQYLVKSLQLQENILFLETYKDSKELISLFDLSDLVIMVPKSDGMPSSMIEAWARKKPVLVSNIENYDSSWDRKLFLKTETTEEAIAGSVKEILSDQSLRSTLVKESSQFLDSLCMQHQNLVIFKHIEIYRNKNRRSRWWRFILFNLFIIEPLFLFKKQ